MLGLGNSEIVKGFHGSGRGWLASHTVSSGGREMSASGADPIDRGAVWNDSIDEGEPLELKAQVRLGDGVHALSAMDVGLQSSLFFLLHYRCRSEYA